MIGRYLTTILAMIFLAGIATAGLDGDGRFDSVIAVYHFEDVTDSGPRGFDGNLVDSDDDLVAEASIVDDGKVDKCLQIQGDGYFGALANQSLSIVNREFSIVAWVKLQQQTHAFKILAVGADNDTTSVGSIELSVLDSGNIKGRHIDFEDENAEVIESEDENVADDNWHHIAYCKHADTYSLYIDGEVVKQEHSAGYQGFASPNTLIVIAGPTDADLTGTVLVDEVGFFKIGFSVYEVKGLYDDGLTDFLEAMPVDPREKVATTWGVIKRDRW